MNRSASRKALFTVLTDKVNDHKLIVIDNLDNTVKSKELSAKLNNLATKAGVEGEHFTFHTPLLKLSKAETILKGVALGVDYAMTVSCYQATAEGKACGRCDSCAFRKQGFASAKVCDPTGYI